MSEIPLLIEFVPGTCLLREEELAQGLPILQNGSPGTFIVFPERFRVSLPTDQIVYSEDRTTGVRIGKATVDPIMVGIGYGFRF